MSRERCDGRREGVGDRAKPRSVGGSPVASLVEEGVKAKYERKDPAAARDAWERALGRLDEPGVTPLDRYQVYAGLGLIHAEREEYTRARELFKQAVTASRQVTDNFKPLSYSHYNLACAEALLGDRDAALGDLRAALEAERKTERRRYVKLAQDDESLASLKDDPRFRALLGEFAEPPATSSKPKLEH
jgi:tetratricopeptide (TPR) repeat protein